MTVRIGFPRGLLYYQYGALWQQFVQNLGCEIVISGTTTARTLDYGGLDEMCLPAKVFHGHVAALASKVDYMCIPRVVSVVRGKYCCPNIIGMPDIARTTIKDLPPLIDISINMRENSQSLYKSVIETGNILGRNGWQTLRAWYNAWRQNTLAPNLSIAEGCPSIAVIGRPYVIYDKQISMDIVGKLGQMGFHVVTSDMVADREAQKAGACLAKELFWSTGHHLVGAALALMQKPKQISGIIFLSCFACGPDALVGELISQQARMHKVPFMYLSVDEHTAEAGFVTRLEAFTDMLLRKRGL